MEVFVLLGVYGMPLIGYLFIVSLLRAIRNIVKDKPYSTELFWSGISFGTIIWTITICALSNTG